MTQYDDWAERYDADTRAYGWVAPQRASALATRFVPPSSEVAVLDLGVGTGQSSATYVDGGARVVGVDASDAMLRCAARRGGLRRLVLHEVGTRSLSEALGDAADGGPFDVVLASGVLHFVEPLEATLGELRGLISPGAVLSVTTIPPQRRSFGARTHVRGDHEVADMLRRTGFVTVHRERFVAYYDRADERDPVEYVLWGAQPG